MLSKERRSDDFNVVGSSFQMKIDLQMILMLLGVHSK